MSNTPHRITDGTCGDTDLIYCFDCDSHFHTDADGDCHHRECECAPTIDRKFLATFGDRPNRILVVTHESLAAPDWFDWECWTDQGGDRHDDEVKAMHLAIGECFEPERRAVCSPWLIERIADSTPVTWKAGEWIS